MALVIVLSLTAIAILVGMWRTAAQTRDTTFVAPRRWTLLAVATMLVTSWLTGPTFDRGAIHDVGGHLQSAEPRDSFAYYLSGTTLFCPMIAILGAKRPQNLGWQWIVLTLWIILVLPAAESWILNFGGRLEVGGLRSWLLAGLLLVGFGNYGMTRHTAAACLATLSASILLAEQLPGGGLWFLRQFAPPWGVLGLQVALLLVCWSRPRNDWGWNRVWFDFRDTFGVVWGIRVMEKINTTARLQRWPVQLTWHGFVPTDQGANGVANQRPEVGEFLEKTGSLAESLDVTLRTVLRRFVSENWINSRLTDPRLAPREKG